MKDSGLSTYFLGLEIQCSYGWVVVVTQNRYTRDLIGMSRLSDSTLIHTPMKFNVEILQKIMVIHFLILHTAEVGFCFFGRTLQKLVWCLLYSSSLDPIFLMRWISSIKLLFVHIIISWQFYQLYPILSEHFETWAILPSHSSLHLQDNAGDWTVSPVTLTIHRWLVHVFRTPDVKIRWRWHVRTFRKAWLLWCRWCNG